MNLPVGREKNGKGAVNFLINPVMIFIVLLIFGTFPRRQMVFFPLPLLLIFFVGSGNAGGRRILKYFTA